MTLIDLFIFLLIVVVFCLVAYWVITKFFPAQYRTYALFIVGIIALIFIVLRFFPSILNTRVGG